MMKNVEPAIADNNNGEITACQVVSEEQYIQAKKKLYEQPEYKLLCRFPDDPEEPYVEIKTKEQFLEVVKKVNEGDETCKWGYFKLCQDLDLEGETICSCGNHEDFYFAGIFDGQGHTISNFNIEQEGQQYAALFGYVKGAVIARLNIEGSVNGGGYAAILAVKSEGGFIQGCTSLVQESENGYGPVLAGENEGTILECILAVKNSVWVKL